MMKFWRIVALTLLALIGVASWFWPAEPSLRHPGIYITAFVVMIAWAWGSAELLLKSNAAKWVWLSGSFLLFNHIAAAFHFGHAWSHQNAIEHTRQMSGVAEGLYVNYAFAMLWLVDDSWRFRVHRLQCHCDLWPLAW
jgi:hypothetical protein